MTIRNAFHDATNRVVHRVVYALQADSLCQRALLRMVAEELPGFHKRQA